MYFVTAKDRFVRILAKMIKKEFGDQIVFLPQRNHIYLKVLTGYPRNDRLLSREEIDAEVCGGGIEMELDGRTFLIKVEEIENDSRKTSQKETHSSTRLVN